MKLKTFNSLKKALKKISYYIIMSEIKETYYSLNKEKIRKKACRMIQCSKCLRIIQFKSLPTHKRKPKCERDYQKRINPPADKNKKYENVEIIYVE